MKFMAYALALPRAHRIRGVVDCQGQRRWRFVGAHRMGAFDRQTVWIFHMFCYETNRHIIFNVFVA